MTFPHDLPPPEGIIQLPVDRFAIDLLCYIADVTNSSWRSRHTIGQSGIWHERGVENRHIHQVKRAAVEAWDWLEHHGLVARDPGETGETGETGEHAYITRRGYDVVHAEEDGIDGLALVQAQARIDVDLHELIAARVRALFLLGEHEAAAFFAMKRVEIRVREVAGMTDQLGVTLMKQAFNEGGPLADPNQDPGERAATMALFWGAIGVFKNPSSHREVDYDDPIMTSEIVMFADLLLRMLDRVEAKVERSKVDESAGIGGTKRVAENRSDGDTPPAA